MRACSRATDSGPTAPVSETSAGRQPPSSAGSAAKSRSATPIPRASSAGERASTLTNPSSRPRRPSKASGVGWSGSTSITAARLRRSSSSASPTNCSPSSVEARTTRADGSANASATAGGTVRRRAAVNRYAVRTASSGRSLAPVAGPSTASAGIAISSHASATSTAWPVAPSGNHATVFTPESRSSTRKRASSSARPKSLPPADSPSTASNRSTSVPRSGAASRNCPRLRSTAASTCVSRVPVSGSRTGTITVPAIAGEANEQTVSQAATATRRTRA